MTQLLKDRYRLTDDSLEGGMARVYWALDEETGQECVVKVLSVAKVKDLKTMELFDRESAVLKSLRHPTIPAYVDAFVDETGGDVRMILVQEAVHGETLEKAIERGRRFTEPELAKLAQQLVSTLRYLHSRNPPVIHRDIKPSNLILGDDGTLYLIDFGAVGNESGPGAGGSTVVGTFGYMAPEQFQGQSGTETDYYALGATLLHALTGRDPSEFPTRELAIELDGQVTCSPVFRKLLDGLLDPFRERREAFLEKLDVLLIAVEKGFVPARKPRTGDAVAEVEEPHPLTETASRKLKWGGMGAAATIMFLATYLGSAVQPGPGSIRALVVAACISLFVSLGLGLRSKAKKRWLWGWFVTMHLVWGSVIAIALAGFPAGQAISPGDFIGALGLTVFGAVPWFLASTRGEKEPVVKTKVIDVAGTAQPSANLDDEADLLDDEEVWQALEEQVAEEAAIEVAEEVV